MTKFQTAARKAIATFLFSTLGVIVGANVMALDVATWQLALSTGLGAILNLLFRWSEAVLAERKGDDGGAVSAMQVLIVLGIVVLIVVLFKLVDVNIR